LHHSFFQLGSLHIPLFGVVAAVGLLAALGLSQRTARYAGIHGDALWDVGMTAMIAAFVISRVLLVVFNLHSFLLYPTLLLAVPSLTTTGVLLTAAFLLVYLRRRRLPLLAVLDASAPCAALIWGFVNLGRIVEGTKDGMPTSLPWGVGDRMLGAVHPVEDYTLVGAAALCLLLLGLLPRKGYTGETTAIGLLLAGVAVFFLDFFRLPSNLTANLHDAWVDPAQGLGLAMTATGCALVLTASSKSSKGKIQEADRIGAGNAI
jgi:phosphatidylglycerol---prolipoprotein diacylglyceryl transferase